MTGSDENTGIKADGIKANGNTGVKAIWVAKTDAGMIWDKVEPLLLSALKHGLPLWETSDIYAGIMNDEMQLWIAVDNEKQKLHGVVVTQKFIFPKANILNVFLLGGNEIKKWKVEMGTKIEEFARNENCSFLQAIGRKGWLPLFEDMFEAATVIIKILE